MTFLATFPTRIFRRGMACVLICSFINLGLVRSVLAQTPPNGKDATLADSSKASAQQDAAKAKKVEKERSGGRKGAIAVTVMGLGFVGGGAALLAQQNHTCYLKPDNIPYSCGNADSMHKGGYIAIGAGSFMTVLGLVMIKRQKGAAWMHRHAPDSRPSSSSAAR